MTPSLRFTLLSGPMRFLLATFVGVSSSVVLAWSNANHNALQYFTPDDCQRVVESVRFPDTEGFDPAAPLSVLSWNIWKGRHPEWHKDFEFMVDGRDLVLLQEAVLHEDDGHAPDHLPWWSFSPGYSNWRYRSGVMTYSRFRPDFFCSLVATEPWLKTPKAASILHFPVRGPIESLLVVNIHVVNFALGTKAFLGQVDKIGEILKAHQGPIVLGGDFNTWRSDRGEIVMKLAEVHGLQEVVFDNDSRLEKFGQVLDYIFVRGFTVDLSDTGRVYTSDHNPLLVDLRFVTD